MKASEVYLRAAELVGCEEYYFSCNAIYKATECCDKYQLIDEYTALFCPVLNPTLCGWLKHNNEAARWNHKEIQRWRVLALLFMSQISKDEEKRK